MPSSVLPNILGLMFVVILTFHLAMASRQSGQSERPSNVFTRRMEGAAYATSASIPLRSITSRSLTEGPLGCFAPLSHCATVLFPTFRTAANTGWLNFAFFLMRLTSLAEKARLDGRHRSSISFNVTASMAPIFADLRNRQ